MSPPHPEVDSRTLGPLRSTPLVARIVLAVVLVAELMNSIDHSIVLNAVPTLRDTLGAGPAAVQWLTVGYSSALAVGLVTGGRLGDAYGRRRILLTGTALFTVASLLCGIAPNPEVLVASRVLQGAGAAIMLPQVLPRLFTSPSAARPGARHSASMERSSRSGPCLARCSVERCWSLTCSVWAGDRSS